MIEEIGTITAVDDDHIWVETQIKTTCSGCQANDNCGTGVVAKAFAPKKDKLIFRCHQRAKVGQKVKLGIPEQALITASALVYMLPLLVLVTSVLVAQSLLPLWGFEHEGFVILSAIVSTGVAFLWVRSKVKQDKNHHYQPRLLEILPATDDAIPIKMNPR